GITCEKSFVQITPSRLAFPPGRARYAIQLPLPVISLAVMNGTPAVPVPSDGIVGNATRPPLGVHFTPTRPVVFIFDVTRPLAPTATEPSAFTARTCEELSPGRNPMPLKVAVPVACEIRIADWLRANGGCAIFGVRANIERPAPMKHTHRTMATRRSNRPDFGSGLTVAV